MSTWWCTQRVLQGVRHLLLRAREACGQEVRVEKGGTAPSGLGGGVGLAVQGGCKGCWAQVRRVGDESLVVCSEHSPAR